jgi:hypothetical protein
MSSDKRCFASPKRDLRLLQMRLLDLIIVEATVLATTTAEDVMIVGEKTDVMMTDVAITAALMIGAKMTTHGVKMTTPAAPTLIAVVVVVALLVVVEDVVVDDVAPLLG